jgi:hypothetical protein
MTTEEPGKYDYLCTVAQQATEAEGTILIILNGILGSGFSVQASADIIDRLPELLETVAKNIRNSLQPFFGSTT